MRLQGRTAIITGGAIGLGRAYALRLASEGSDIAVWDIDGEGAEQTANLVREKGRRGLGIRADVTVEDEVRQAVEATYQAFGRIDILVNNAGIVRNVYKAPIEELELKEWNRLINVNLTGTFIVSKAVVPYLKRNGKGKIINISSGVALHGTSLRQDYAASKAGVIGLTRALASELGEFNINVNVVTPGAVITPELREQLGGKVPENFTAGRYIPRPIYAEDLEGVIAFLASDESDLMTGQVVNVDGGKVFVG